MKKLLPLLALLLLLCACDTAPDAPETLPETESETVADTASETSAQTPLAPDFTVLDRDGNKVSLSSLRGKPVVLNFWASWCGPCKSEMPDFEAAYQKYGADVQFIMVNLTDGKNETVESAIECIDSLGYNFPIYFDTESEAVAAYGISAIPATFFINAEGQLVTYATGAIGSELIEKGIGMITTAE